MVPLYHAGEPCEPATSRQQVETVANSECFLLRVLERIMRSATVSALNRRR